MPKIDVEFVDRATQQVLGRAQLAAESLPESFATSTTLHLGGTDWHVEHASSVTRAEYVAAGRLRLVLSKIEHVDPKKILFSLPTLENALPPLREADPSAAYALHEDDWRQVELVAVRFAPEIAAELAAIRGVREERQGVGFLRLHVRERIPAPLAGIDLGLADVRAAIGGEAARCEVTFRGAPGVVDGGFAFVVEDGAVYGREDGGRVASLAFAHGADPAVLGGLARTRGLVIVDWCAATMTEP